MNYFRSLFLLFTLASTISLAQKKKTPKKANITAEQALKSEDLKTIAAFIRNHPDDPQIPQLKSKLIQLLKPTIAHSSAAKHSSKSSTQTKRTLSSPQKQQNDETSEILNHLFSNDTGIKNSFVQISNKSNCDITVSFSGRKQNYSLNIAKRSKNHILIEKGEYMISSIVCNAQFATNKNIQKDITMVLGN